MHGLEISAIFDLGGKTARSAVSLRDVLLEKLRDPETSSYSFEYGGISVYPILGELVRVGFSRHGSSRSEVWVAFEGLNTKVAEIKEGGTDHFPAAGFYHASTIQRSGISGASATVRWKLDHAYPLSEDVIGTVVRNAHSNSSFTEAIRLEVPVVYSRSWSLTLTAPTLKRAHAAYELLRNGTWQPKTTFVDKLDDMQKLRLLQQTVERED